MVQKSTRNQLGNAHNTFQGKAKRVLCICSAGMLRSPTAANVLHREFGFNTRSAGISDFALVPVSEVLLEWADQIVCMNDDHKRQLLFDCLPLMGAEGVRQLEKDVVALGIPDEFEFMNEELQKIILERYKEHTGQINNG